MIFCFLLKMLGDLSLLYAAANSILLPADCDISSFAPAVILSLCGALGYALNGKNTKLRFLSLVPMPLVFVLYHAGNLITLLVILVSCAYVVLCVAMPRFELSHEERTGFLSISWKVLLVCLLFRIFFLSSGDAGPAFVPYVLICAVSTLTLTQMLRHDEKILNQPRFRLLSLGLTAALLLLIAFISSPAFLSFVLSAAKFLYHWTIMPLLLLLSYLLGSVILLVAKLLPSPTWQNKNINDILPNFSLSEDNTLKNIEPVANPGFEAVFRSLFAVAVVVLIVVFFVRMLRKRKYTQRDSSIKETRGRINQNRKFREKASADLIAPKEPRQAVRYYYRRFLRTCKRMGSPFSEDMNSKMVAQRAAETLTGEYKPQLENIRNVYIKARYSQHDIDRKDVQTIKENYQQIKKAADDLEKRL